MVILTKKKIICHFSFSLYVIMTQLFQEVNIILSLVYTIIQNHVQPHFIFLIVFKLVSTKKQNTLLWDCEIYTPRRGACLHYFKWVSSILQYYEVNILLWDRKAYTPRRGAYPHYYEPIMEAVRSNPCISLPLEILKQVDCLEIIVI